MYPFQPQSLLAALSWFVLFGMVLVSLWTLVNMERNGVLSYATGSEPGRVTWDGAFIMHLFLFVGLPVAALVAVHFPEVGRPVFDWLQPLVNAAK